ncbi:sister chromatid cohesion C-terminus-domain-containing protein [Mycena metata]|uniref:Sister chromatid cohesion protein n=1 Tax=Mycena metata TaxID=1033252 RepID=A0AAD7HHE2_9AGAR|nr:sister chromatid cohesion C-terminus-domain-containing protein [Mycena metata]
MSGQWFAGAGSSYAGEHQNVDAVQDTHASTALLALYPLASANPSIHVTRHLSSLSLSGAPPSTLHPQYYAAYPQGNPPPYTEYPPDAQYLASEANDSGYWESARNEASAMISQQAESSYPYPGAWSPTNAQASTFRPNAFAQSVLHRANPATAYPTPPPPSSSSSSSSLAGALGPPPPPPQTTFLPQQSPPFFDNFLAQKSKEIARPLPPPQPRPLKVEVAARHGHAPQASTSRPPVRPTTPPQTTRPTVEESPDPLAIAPQFTPRKRKSVTQLDSPSVKRVHSPNPTSVPVTPSTGSRRSLMSTPSTSHSSMSTPSRQRMLYVDVPTKAWATTPKSKMRPMDPPDSPNDLGGYGSDDDTPPRPRLSQTGRTSSRRTGDRDDRLPLEKLTALLDEIFEAEDALPPDVDLSSLPAEFFSLSTTIDCSRPLLQPALIRKLTKHILQVVQPPRMRHKGTGGTPRSKDRSLADVDTVVLSRILKLLERSIKAGEDIDPFPGPSAGAAPGSAPSSPRKPTKKAKGKRRSKSRSGDEADPEPEQMDVDSAAPKVPALTSLDYAKLARALETGRDSILAADCCLALLGGGRLTKQLYSEELITACMSTVKNQLTKAIYPFIEASAAAVPASELLLHVIRSGDHASMLHETFQGLSAVLPRLSTLVNAETVAMSDSIIIQAVYIAIGPFFVVDAGEEGGGKKEKASAVIRTFGKSAMRGLRLDALSLIRAIFANHDDQREWIIEEILTSLIKLSDTKQKAGQFRLRDGRTIRTVSALLLQLVQTSAHDVRITAHDIAKQRQNKFALKRQESISESQSQSQIVSEEFLDEQDSAEIRLYRSGLESATKAAKKIIIFLTQRSGKGKATKNSNEAEYRSIFDNLISDLLSVLYWPEYPAASLLLNIASKFMVASLDDVKTSQTDSNAAKTMALDHLGVIAARIRTSMLKFQPGAPATGGSGEVVVKSKPLKPLDEIVSSLDSKRLDRLLASHQDVAAHLAKRSSEEQAYHSARELTAATLGQELALALDRVNLWISHPDEDDDLNLRDDSKLQPFGQKIKTALHNVWKEQARDVFDIGSQEEAERIDRLAEEIGTIQMLRNSFQPILNIILVALDAPPIFMRTKALRALGQIVTSDPTILAEPNVRRAIESHLLDSSPAVRDAAVELIGKYMIDSPEVAGDYYNKIADRMADTGLSVRKRVIKLLKSFYAVTDDNSRKIDIAMRLVMRMVDEDDTVKELAIKTLEELWFPVILPSAMKSRGAATANQDKSALLTKVAVIMGTSAHFNDRQSPLEDILHQIIAEKQGNEAAYLHTRYAEICEALIDGLVDASDLPGFTVINCVRTIYLFTASYPAILSGSNASTLLPYLKNPTTAEEQATTDYLLKIFRASIPHMPRTAIKFGQELQTTLQPMVIKPSSVGGLQGLQETVACMCTVVQCLTHEFSRLVALLKSCNARIQQYIKRAATTPLTPSDIRSLSILIVIIALLGEHCDFERMRKEAPAVVSDLESISPSGPIIEHIYDSLLQLYENCNDASLRGRILQCLGFLFRAQPSLMTMPRSALIMDDIFSSTDEERQGRLLKIIQDFLISEAAKHAAKQKDTIAIKGKTKPSDVNMDELVGNTDGFADSGVSSAVVQRYINHILNAALSQVPQIQAAAIDVLTFTIKQGLAHPLQSFPVIVALETSPSPNLSGRASALHSVLHQKHASLLNTRYIESARASFDYQRRAIPDQVQGFRMQPTPIALLQRWYSLVREKRPARQEFLKSLVKVFHLGRQDPSRPAPVRQDEASQDDVDFARYMAENFSSFEYKTQEEVITVIKDLTAVLSVDGTRLLEIISPSHLLSHLRAPEPMEVDAQEDGSDKRPLMRASVIIGMVMLLKAHLKNLYSLSEDKCSKFVSGKKSAVGDKAVTKRNEKPISWTRLPYATAPILTTSDVDSQKARFIEVWNEDGVSAEPEDEFT